MNKQLDAFRVTEGEARRRLEHELQQVEEELRNVERAILAGVVSETTAALGEGTPGGALEARGGTGLIRADADAITGHLARLDDLLHRDVARANAFFRAHIAPVTCTPVKQNGRKSYRATVAANGTEIVSDAFWLDLLHRLPPPSEASSDHGAPARRSSGVYCRRHDAA